MNSFEEQRKKEKEAVKRGIEVAIQYERDISLCTILGKKILLVNSDQGAAGYTLRTKYGFSGRDCFDFWHRIYKHEPVDYQIIARIVYMENQPDTEDDIIRHYQEKISKRHLVDRESALLSLSKMGSLYLRLTIQSVKLWDNPINFCKYFNNPSVSGIHTPWRDIHHTSTNIDHCRNYVTITMKLEDLSPNIASAFEIVSPDKKGIGGFNFDDYRYFDVLRQMETFLPVHEQGKVDITFNPHYASKYTALYNTPDAFLPEHLKPYLLPGIHYQLSNRYVWALMIDWLKKHPALQKWNFDSDKFYGRTVPPKTSIHPNAADVERIKNEIVSEVIKEHKDHINAERKLNVDKIKKAQREDINKLRIKWGSEDCYKTLPEVINKQPCPACGVPFGEYHIDGCDDERCGGCGGQLSTCGIVKKCKYGLMVNELPGFVGYLRKYKTQLLSDTFFDGGVPPVIRLKWSGEIDYIELAKTKRGSCPECKVKIGEYHEDGCDIERCPICAGQLSTCGCDKKFPFVKVWNF